MRNNCGVHNESRPQPLVSASDIEAPRLNQLHCRRNEHRLGWQAVEPLKVLLNLLCDFLSLEVFGLAELQQVTLVVVGRDGDSLHFEKIYQFLDPCLFEVVEIVPAPENLPCLRVLGGVDLLLAIRD